MKIEKVFENIRARKAKIFEKTPKIKKNVNFRKAKIEFELEVLYKIF